MFIRNKVKISDLPNIKSIINIQNKKILCPSPTIGRRTCNSINKPESPKNQKCLSNNILYQASISTDENSENEVYHRICETTLKLLYANHKKSFNHTNCKSDTELCNKFWKIKNSKRSLNITWGILSRNQAYNTGSKRCSLCLNEKLEIALHRSNNMCRKKQWL